MTTFKSSPIGLRFARLLHFSAARALVALAALCTAVAAHAAYPERSIRIIVPWPAGGSADLIGRVLADQLSKQLGVSVVVDNRPGANGVIGTGAVASAAPDGYTLLSTVSEPLTINPATYKSLPYDVDKQLEPLALTARTHFVMLASKSFAGNTVQETIRLAKQKPGTLTVGSYGIADMFLASFEYETGTSFLKVPYQGAAPAMAAILGSVVDLTLVASSTAVPALGSVKVLAIGSAAPLPMLPNVKTFDQQGLKGFMIGNWSALLAPKGIPDEVRNRLRPAIEAAVRSEEFRARLAKVGIDAEYAAPDALRTFMRADAARWRKVVVEKNIPMQQ